VCVEIFFVSSFACAPKTPRLPSRSILSSHLIKQKFPMNLYKYT
jgi:hypothetical protein